MDKYGNYILREGEELDRESCRLLARQFCNDWLMHPGVYGRTLSCCRSMFIDALTEKFKDISDGAGLACLNADNLAEELEFSSESCSIACGFCGKYDE